MVVYLLAAIAIRWWCGGFKTDDPTRFVLTHVFDGVTMATSLLILWGVMDDNILKLIGNTKPFLLIAGFAGFAYAIFALRPR